MYEDESILASLTERASDRPESQLDIDEGGSILESLTGKSPSLPKTSKSPFTRDASEASFYGLRTDGTPKGLGYFGELQRPDKKVSTELSIGVDFGGKETQIPSLVPTLTSDEVDYLLQGNQPTQDITDKAVAHARTRISQGKSPFAQEGEQVSRPVKTEPMNFFMQDVLKRFQTGMPLTEADFERGVPSIESLTNAPRVGQAAEAGFKASIPAMAVRGELPEPFESKDWIERAVQGAAKIVPELPIYAAGSLLAGGPETPLGWAGAFALPAAVEDVIVRRLQEGKVDSAYELLDRAKSALAEAGKGAVVGVGTYAGGLAGKVAAPLKFPGTVAGLVGTQSAIEGRAPTFGEFSDATILLGLLHVVGATPKKLAKVFTEKKMPPEELVKQASEGKVEEVQKLLDEVKVEMAPEEPVVEVKRSKKPTKDQNYLDKAQELKKQLGEETYYEVLKGLGIEKSNQVRSSESKTAVLRALRSRATFIPEFKTPQEAAEFGKRATPEQKEAMQREADLLEERAKEIIKERGEKSKKAMELNLRVQSLHEALTPEETLAAAPERKVAEKPKTLVIPDESQMTEEAKSLGAEFAGIQEGVKGEKVPLFTDNETGSTFAVDFSKKQNIAEELARVRKIFAEAKVEPKVESKIEEKPLEEELEFGEELDYSKMSERDLKASLGFAKDLGIKEDVKMISEELRKRKAGKAEVEIEPPYVDLINVEPIADIDAYRRGIATDLKQLRKTGKGDLDDIEERAERLLASRNLGDFRDEVEFDQFSELNSVVLDLIRKTREEKGLEPKETPQVDLEDALLFDIDRGKAEIDRDWIDRFTDAEGNPRPLIFDNLGLQQIYERSIEALRARPSFENLKNIGRGIILEGKTKYGEFRTRMKEVVGDLWNDIKGFVREAYEDAKKWKIFTDEKGMVTLGKGKPINEGALQLEADRLEIIYNGIQEGVHGEQIPLFTDSKTRSTFAVNFDKGQTVEGEMNKTRTLFDKGQTTEGTALDFLGLSQIFDSVATRFGREHKIDREISKAAQRKRDAKIKMATDVDIQDLIKFGRSKGLTSRDVLKVAKHKFGFFTKLSELTHEQADVVKISLELKRAPKILASEELIRSDPNVLDSTKKELRRVIDLYDIDDIMLDDHIDGIKLLLKRDTLDNKGVNRLIKSLKNDAYLKPYEGGGFTKYIQLSIRRFGEPFIDAWTDYAVKKSEVVTPFLRASSKAVKGLTQKEKEAIGRYAYERDIVSNSKKLSEDQKTQKISELENQYVMTPKMTQSYEAARAILEKGREFFKIEDPRIDYFPRMSKHYGDEVAVAKELSAEQKAKAEEAVKKGKVPRAKIPDPLRDFVWQAEFKRKGTLQDVEFDIYAVLQRYALSGARKLYGNDALRKVRPMIAKMEPDRQQEAKDWISAVIRKDPTQTEKALNNSARWLKRKLGFRVSEGERAYRDLMGSAMNFNYASFLGVRPKLIIRNWTQHWLTANEAGWTSFLKGYSKAYSREITDAMSKSPFMRERLQKWAVEEEKVGIADISKDVRDTMLWAYRKVEVDTCRGAFSTGYFRAKELNPNLPEKYYIRAGDKMVRDTQWGYGYDLPIVFKSTIGKMFLQYMSWPISYADHLYRIARENNWSTKGARTAAQVAIFGALYYQYGANYLSSVMFGTIPQAFGWAGQSLVDLGLFFASIGTPQLRKRSKDVMEDAWGIVPGYLSAKEIQKLKETGDWGQYLFYVKSEESRKGERLEHYLPYTGKLEKKRRKRKGLGGLSGELGGL